MALDRLIGEGDWSTRVRDVEAWLSTMRPRDLPPFETQGVTNFTRPVTHPSPVGLVERNVQLTTSLLRNRTFDSGLEESPWVTYLAEDAIRERTAPASKCVQARISRAWSISRVSSVVARISM